MLIEKCLKATFYLVRDTKDHVIPVPFCSKHEEEIYIVSGTL